MSLQNIYFLVRWSALLIPVLTVQQAACNSSLMKIRSQIMHHFAFLRYLVVKTKKINVLEVAWMRHSDTVSQHGLASDVSRRITSPRDHAPPISMQLGQHIVCNSIRTDG